MRISYERPWSAEVLRTFVDRFNQRSGGRVPLSYFEESMVNLAVTPDREVVGGYALRLRAPLRGLLVLPREWREALERSYPETDLVEVNGVWLSEEVPPLQRLRFWRRLLGDVSKSGRGQLLVWYNHDVARFRRIYRWFRAEPFYIGPAAGLKTHASVFVGVAPTASFGPFLRRMAADCLWRQARSLCWQES